MIQTLELPDQDFKISMIEMLKKIQEKMDTIDENMENLDQEPEPIKEYKMDILELKNTLSERRIPLNGLNSAGFIAESRIRELKDRSIENNQTKAQREKKSRTEPKRHVEYI